jgi:hypothetical protein
MDHQRSPIAEDLLIGAAAIAEFLYGNPRLTRDVYRNAMGLPFFRHGAQITATKSGLTQEIRNRENAARETILAREKARSP